MGAPRRGRDAWPAHRERLGLMSSESARRGLFEARWEQLAADDRAAIRAALARVVELEAALAWNVYQVAK